MLFHELRAPRDISPSLLIGDCPLASADRVAISISTQLFKHYSIGLSPLEEKKRISSSDKFPLNPANENHMVENNIILSNWKDQRPTRKCQFNSRTPPVPSSTWAPRHPESGSSSLESSGWTAQKRRGPPAFVPHTQAWVCEALLCALAGMSSGIFLGVCVACQLSCGRSALFRQVEPLRTADSMHPCLDILLPW